MEFFPSRWLAAVMLVAALALPAAAEEAGIEAGSGGNGWTFWLNALEEYRGRFSSKQGTIPASNLVDPLGSESDHDLRLYLDGAVSSPEEQFRADLALALWFDIDDVPAAGEPTALASMYDYRRLWWNLYRVSADWAPGGVIKLLRGGRQPSRHGPAVTFDGVAAEFTLLERQLDVFVFGGRSVHFFEADADLFEDWLGSAGISWRVDEHWRAELDYRLQVEDVAGENLGPRQDITDHAVGFAAWYRRSDRVLSKFWWRTWNDQLAEIGWRNSLLWPHWNMGIEYTLAGQTATLRELAEREDPYFTILGESRPHLRWRLDVWKGYRLPWTFLALHLGSDGKRLFESRDEGPFNRSSGRVYGMLTADDIGTRGLYAAVALEGHFAGEQGRLSSDMIFTVSGFAGYRCPANRFAAELGTTYQRYKLDYYLTVSERENVRTVYLSGRVRILEWLGLKLRYEYERADRDIHTVTAAVTQNF